MIFRSIKWRLQLWHGLTLLMVLVGFGYTAFELQRTREFRRVDQELHEHMAALIGPLRRPGRPFGPRDGPPPSDASRPRPPGMPPEIGRDVEGAFPEDGPFYFVVWDREGRIVRQRGAAENIRPRAGGRRGPIGMRDEYRELQQVTPRGETVLVGRSIAPELKEMRNLAYLLIGSGFAILALGLAGGWVVATRAMQPVEKISVTAQKIASGDLSQRIVHAEAESELGRLVAVLNSTFARLDSAFAEQVRFTTDVSHELRTPVSVIVSQTQMALSRERSATDYREALEASQRAAQRMRKLIESLLQLSRLDAGQEEIRRFDFDLAQIAKEAVDLLRSLAEEKKIEMIQQLEPVRVSGDSERLAQVITNLLSNAIAYTPPGGRVTISSRSENGLAVLTISDTGIGIPAHDIPHVFERFYRVETSRSRDKGGSGLGLAIARAIVHAHGGTIELKSTAGQGTEFTVRLPSVP
jgi:two-component system OmpR family sensor kinase